MGVRKYLGVTVFDAALERLMEVYREGHRVLVSFSAGKDSGVCVELAILAASLTGRLPVEVVMRDEEIMFPGTYEYAERVAARPEVRFHWLIAGQPQVNVFNRAEPYFWTFDDRLRPDQWMRQPPAFAEWIPEKNIKDFSNTRRFPPDPGRDVISVLGLRTQESRVRTMTIHSARGALTSRRTDAEGVSIRNLRPIYDWSTGDIWRAVRENGWDYNRAYDAMHRAGVSARNMRIGPPTMTHFAVDALKMARAAWPNWFDRLSERLPGVRTIAMFGRVACSPARRLGETWKETYRRECIEEAPAEWLRSRCEFALERFELVHAQHATTPFPDVHGCNQCRRSGNVASWKAAAHVMYNGNPFGLNMTAVFRSGTRPEHGLYMEPEFFRPGSGTWGGKPTW